MAIREIDDYLERRGAKYFVALLMFCYVLGTVIFNIYLSSLGVFEFELLQLRYMFVGAIFLGSTGAAFMSILQLFRLTRNSPAMLSEAQQRQREKRVELCFLIFVIAWTPVYATKVLPKIPSGFGGAQPVLARLIGPEQNIKRINELIAFETGVSVDKLSFEKTSPDSDLAVGANVQILDRNQDRIFLLLTKDLYLRSTSSLANDLIESGKDAEDLQTIGTQNFKQKPLIVKADKIEGITLTLYEPPAVLTASDLEVAATVLASEPTAPTRDETKETKVVEQFIKKTAPSQAAEIINTVTEKVQAPTTPQEELPPTPEVKVIPPELESKVFLDMRSRFFTQALLLSNIEAASSKRTESRFDLVKTISDQFSTEFPEAWAILKPDNYLIKGQIEPDFPRILSQIWQGAASPEVVIERLNTQEVDDKVAEEFQAAMKGSLELLAVSNTKNSATNRKYVSVVLNNHLNKKHRRYKTYWQDPGYLTSGRADEDFFANLEKTFTESQNWEELKEILLALHAQILDRTAQQEL